MTVANWSDMKWTSGSRLVRQVSRFWAVGLAVAAVLWSYEVSARVHHRQAAFPSALSTPDLDLAPVRALGPDATSAHVLRAVLGDVDRDGDLDIVATTVDQPVAIWLNDGRGHFARQPAPLTPGFSPPVDTLARASSMEMLAVAPTRPHSSSPLTPSVLGPTDRAGRPGALDAFDAPQSLPDAADPARGPPALFE